MSLSEAWIEHDYNPFILFNEEGKVKTLNKEAQYLLGETNAKEIFELTQTYASYSFGFKTTILDTTYGSYKFYAITVGYENEKEIGIKLYKTAGRKFINTNEHGDTVNIYALLDLCISASSTRIKAKFTKEFDPTFPEVKLKIDSFSKLLEKIYQSCSQATYINTKLSLITGEYIKYDDKKYPIFSICITSDNRDSHYEKELETISLKSNTIIRFHKNSTILNSPMIFD